MAANTTSMNSFVAFRNPADLIEKHFTFFLCEVVNCSMALLTLIHALRNGGRYSWLWLSIILHGITVELVSYFVPDIDNFWHAQSMIMFAYNRLPIYVVVIYAVFLYTASVAVSHMNLKWWAEPFAVGLSVVLLDVPFDILGIKLLWWTWHDTDPNIYDRHYWVPWTSYYFHASFASGLTFAFHGYRKLLSPKGTNKFQSAGFFRELLASVLTGVSGMPLGVLQFLPLYHPLHDTHKIHTEVCVCMFLAMYVAIVWAADRRSGPDPSQVSPKHERKNKYFNELTLLVLIHYSFYMILSFIAKPEKEVSIGLHEPIGPCQETVPVYTAFGHVLAKKKYLCLTNYDEAIFDFHCVKELPKPGDHWYTVCGTKFPNHLEYICVVCFFCVFGLYWYYQLLVGSASLPSPKKPKDKQN